MDLLVDTNTLIDLAILDELEFLKTHAFFVAPELPDLLKKPDVVARLDTSQKHVEEYNVAVTRLRAFLPFCKEPPVGDVLDAMKWSNDLAQLRLDPGEHVLCWHLPRLPASVVVTGDMKAVERLQQSQSKHGNITVHFHDRIIGFEELMFLLLNWKSFPSMKNNLYQARWRREQLANAFLAKGPATQEPDFRRYMASRAKTAAKTYAPFLKCSWP